MEELEKQVKENKVNEVKTFPVTFASGEIKENITITTNNPSKPSKEQIINQAYKFHSQGNILEATKYYEYFINKGFKDHVTFANYGLILKDLGKLKDAELLQRKAIEITPDFAEAHLNLGIIFRDLDQLQEAEDSTRKAIKLNPDLAEAHYNLGSILKDLDQSKEAELSYRKAIEINPNFADSHYNLGNILNSLGKLDEGEKSIVQCLKVNENHLQGSLTLSAMKLHQGDNSLLKHLIKSNQSNNPFLNSLKWVSGLPKLPEVFFDRYSFYDAIITQSIKNRPFYEFGVYKGSSFKYLMKTFKKGYGFDTFEGLPENWNHFKKGAFSTQGTIPEINGGTFIAGMFEETLPTFFSKPRPIASVINFDADLYSSTVCALNYSKPIIDKDTILIFDEFIVHENWEQDEYRAFNEFCLNNNFTYEVLAVSYSTCQTAVKIIGI
ncbi:protein arginine N-methyltransferase [Prochlorococcus marinus]|uniref:protein arginine N-methyltransferase n=1 Tax=Prochlorococcus marinus TaxID=1219 RepID=UPI0022B58AC1|nr:tetratricopeptide repeat protein [Prochlorococcus marinus]